MTTNEIKYEPTKEQQEDQVDDNIIELRNQLYQEEADLFPIAQEAALRRHRISQLKLRIQNANSLYFQNKGM
jgi:hypothetical protein